MSEHQNDGSEQIPDPAIEPTITIPRAAKIICVGQRTGYDAVTQRRMARDQSPGTYRIPTARFLAMYEFSSPNQSMIRCRCDARRRKDPEIKGKSWKVAGVAEAWRRHLESADHAKGSCTCGKPLPTPTPRQ